MIKEYNLLISSVGGQGGVTLSRILSSAALSQGVNIRVGETLGMAQRGGSVQSHVRFGEAVYGPFIPEGGSDVLLSLEPAETLRVLKYIGRKTKIIMNTSPERPISVLLNEATYPEISEIVSLLEKIGNSVYPFNAFELAKRAGSSRSLNIVILGAYTVLEKQILTLANVRDAMKKILPSRFARQNEQALNEGIIKMKELMSTNS